MKVATQKISFDNGKSMTARWLGMDGGEFFLQTDTAILLGLTEEGIRSIMRDNKHLSSVRPTHETVEFLRIRSIVAKTGRPPQLLPRATVDALVKIVNTTEAWAIWAQILNAVRNPTASVALHQEIGGLEQVTQVMNAAIAVMAVNTNKQSELIKLCEDKLRANNITPCNSKYLGSTYHNGTLNSFYKHLNSKFAPTLAEDMSGREFFTRVLNAENYNEVCEYVVGMEMTPSLFKTLNSVQKKRQALLSPTINNRKIYHTKRNER